MGDRGALALWAKSGRIGKGMTLAAAPTLALRRAVAIEDRDPTLLEDLLALRPDTRRSPMAWTRAALSGSHSPEFQRARGVGGALQAPAPGGRGPLSALAVIPPNVQALRGPR